MQLLGNSLITLQGSIRTIENQLWWHAGTSYPHVSCHSWRPWHPCIPYFLFSKCNPFFLDVDCLMGGPSRILSGRWYWYRARRTIVCGSLSSRCFCRYLTPCLFLVLPKPVNSLEMVLSNFHLHEGPTSLGIDLFTAHFYLEKVGDAYKKASHQDFCDQTTQRATMKTVPRAGN